MKLSQIVSTLVASATVTLVCSLPAQAALEGRDGNRVATATASDPLAVYVYDTTLDVTWVRNSYINGATANTWAGANAWAAALTTGNAGYEISDWRLPTMGASPNETFSNNGSTSNGSNVPTSSSEMANLYFGTLGNSSYLDTAGVPRAFGSYGLLNSSPFAGLQANGAYWTNTSLASDSSKAWYFDVGNGKQTFEDKGMFYYSLAVRSGDVMLAAPVPEPETYLMLLVGLGAVGAMARRRKGMAAA